MTRLKFTTPELFRLWHSELTNEELCRKLQVARSTLDSLRMRYGLPRRRWERKSPQDYIENNPTPDEIAARAAEIRAGWPEGEEERRMVGDRSMQWRMPSYAFNRREHSFSEAGY